MVDLISKKFVAACLFGIVFLASGGCSPVSGPDKSVAGAVLGAGWGAGAGAVVGNQLNDRGPGAAVGAGLGAASGLAAGIALDVQEGTELANRRELDALEVQVQANQRELISLQDKLDRRGRFGKALDGSFQVFFDEDRASLRGGNASRLQRFAEALKSIPTVKEVHVHGHSDDSGNVERNTALSEARARSVEIFLTNQGVSADSIKVFAHGARQPLASNHSEAGRQLNRRAEIVVMR